MAVIYKITNASDRARVRRLERPRQALNATEEEERYVTPPFRHAKLRRVSRWISAKGPDAAELVLDHIARAA